MNQRIMDIIVVIQRGRYRKGDGIQLVDMVDQRRWRAAATNLKDKPERNDWHLQQQVVYSEAVNYVSALEHRLLDTDHGIKLAVEAEKRLLDLAIEMIWEATKGRFKDTTECVVVSIGIPAAEGEELTDEISIDPMAPSVIIATEYNGTMHTLPWTPSGRRMLGRWIFDKAVVEQHDQLTQRAGFEPEVAAAGWGRAKQ